MTLKEIFKTTEGIAVTAAFVAIIVTGAKIFAYVGLGAYVVINLPNGISKTKSAIKFILKKVGLIK